MDKNLVGKKIEYYVRTTVHPVTLQDCKYVRHRLIPLDQYVECRLLVTLEAILLLESTRSDGSSTSTMCCRRKMNKI